MDGKPYWNGMIWGENPLFSETSKNLGSCGRVQLQFMGIWSATLFRGNGLTVTMPAKLVQQDEDCQKIVWDDAYTPRETNIFLAGKSHHLKVYALAVFRRGVSIIWVFPKIGVPPNHPF